MNSSFWSHIGLKTKSETKKNTDNNFFLYIFSFKDESIVDKEVTESVRRKLKKPNVEEKNSDHDEEDVDKDERSERRYALTM